MNFAKQKLEHLLALAKKECKSGEVVELEAAISAFDTVEQELLHTQFSMVEVQDLFGGVSCFVENLEHDLSGRTEAFDRCLEIGNKIRNLNLPEFTQK